MTDHFRPPGVAWTDGATGRNWLYCTDGQWKGWLLRQHPDGQWVSMRKATDDDRKMIAAAVRALDADSEPRA